MNTDDYNSGNFADLLDWRLIAFIILGVAAAWGLSWVMGQGMEMIKP